MTIVFDDAQVKILKGISPILKKWEHWIVMPGIPLGIYLYGPPGSGKTTLMDHVYNNFKGKKFRQHLKPFMLDLQQLGFEEAIANLRRVRLVCFDELEIMDIADAMIFGRFLKRCQQHRVKLFFTTNLAPGDLYQDGLHRDRFLPTIGFIEHNYKILKLDNNIDYRMHHKATATQQIVSEQMDVCVVDQMISFDHYSNGTARAQFDTIFNRPLGPRHFRWMAEQLDCLYIENTPIFNENNIDAGRRLTTAVDLFYDLGKRIVLDADFEIENTGRNLRRLSSKRIISRLHEMK